jgi:hypothetical protein
VFYRGFMGKEKGFIDKTSWKKEGSFHNMGRKTRFALLVLRHEHLYHQD